MTKRTTRLLRGHALREEGAPYTETGQRIGIATGAGYGQRGGDGHALCECGATSPLLHSDRQRKAWHTTTHKPAIIAQQASHTTHTTRTQTTT